MELEQAFLEKRIYTTKKLNSKPHLRKNGIDSAEKVYTAPFFSKSKLFSFFQTDINQQKSIYFTIFTQHIPSPPLTPQNHAISGIYTSIFIHYIPSP